MTVISGGQTGVDQAGLIAARQAGLTTGGWAPRGWRTQAGTAPWLRDFGLRAHASSAYPPRTEENVKMAEATLVFGDRTSAGCRLTAKLCADYSKPVFFVPWTPGGGVRCAQSLFAAWLTEVHPAVLNVAGNREESAPGIYVAAYYYLFPVFSEVHRAQV